MRRIMSSEPGGADRLTAYTPATMDAGTLGERRGPDVEALYADAQSELSRSANELRAITERLRQGYAALTGSPDGGPLDGVGPDGPEPDDAELVAEQARARSFLSRLELTTRDLEDSWRFLERGVVGEWSDTGRAFVDQPGFQEAEGSRIAKRILEAQEGERARLAEEIHDGPAQALANVSFQVQIIERMLDRDPAAARTELAAMRRTMDRELHKMRSFIHELRPSLDDAGGLASALGDTADRLRAETSIEVTLDLQAPEDDLDLDGRTAALRVAQEALRNVGKHAGAQHVIVATRDDPAEAPRGPAWVLEVRDDGRGFSVDEVLERSARRHFGLRFMRERAQLVNGHLEIDSDVATGTTVRLRLKPRERSEQA
jgi:signal transduction histidine kinase